MTIGAERLSFLSIGAADSLIHEFKFSNPLPAFDLSRGFWPPPWEALEIPHGFDVRVRVELVRRSQASPRLVAERWVANAMERVESELFRMAKESGYTDDELGDIVTAIDNLINARISRALEIHCTADHSEA